MGMTIDVERYARHIVLREIGGPGQQALAKAHIAIIGAGGLGSPAALYLAAAGVGKLTLIDMDTVSLDNLQRQILFRTEDVGQSKVDVGAATLHALNPQLAVERVSCSLDDANADTLLSSADIILDGCDNFETRFAADAASRRLGLPLVSGAVGRWDGQVAVFNRTPASPCYRCWVPELPPDAETCARVGVVGALTGVIGSMMALEAIKLVTGAGDVLDGRILLFDGLSMTSRTVKLKKDPACAHCSH
ncbi:MAG: molybdopterin-synthase adenylyltransferase MoeB [Alphaproteobacteria bacterium]|nr:molybdopterin-synthase adenylyltransferase MoeB [Alphaproteobacteria bacterium]